MKLLTIIVLFFAHAGTAFALDADIFRQMQDFEQYFDGGIRRGPDGFIPNMPSPKRGFIPQLRGGLGGAAPKIEKSGPAEGNWGPYKDAFAGREECRILDLVFVRQPSHDEALRELRPCLALVARDYGVRLEARFVDGKLSLDVIAPGALGNRIQRDLAHGLALRDGKIFGYAAALNRDAEAEKPAEVSSLQFSIDRCANLRGAKGGPALVEALRDCLLQERYLHVTDLQTDPEDPSVLIVYTQAPADKAGDMNGVVSVQAHDRRFTVRTRTEIHPTRVRLNIR